MGTLYFLQLASVTFVAKGGGVDPRGPPEMADVCLSLAVSASPGAEASCLCDKLSGENPKHRSLGSQGCHPLTRLARRPRVGCLLFAL